MPEHSWPQNSCVENRSSRAILCHCNTSPCIQSHRVGIDSTDVGHGLLSSKWAANFSGGAVAIYPRFVPVTRPVSQIQCHDNTRQTGRQSSDDSPKPPCLGTMTFGNEVASCERFGSSQRWNGTGRFKHPSFSEDGAGPYHFGPTVTSMKNLCSLRAPTQRTVHRTMMALKSFSCHHNTIFCTCSWAATASREEY